MQGCPFRKRKDKNPLRSGGPLGAKTCTETSPCKKSQNLGVLGSAHAVDHHRSKQREVPKQAQRPKIDAMQGLTIQRKKKIKTRAARLKRSPKEAGASTDREGVIRHGNSVKPKRTA